MKKPKSVEPPRIVARDSVTPVYRRIRRMIMSGHLKGGQVLSQVQLALDFNTSRGPVREALRMLQQENLIEAEANQQGRIVSFSVEDIEQASALLTLNTAIAIKLGVGKFSKHDLASVERLIDRIEAIDSQILAKDVRSQKQTWRRQLIFRRLTLVLAKHAGPQVTQLLADLLDRLAMFRQFHQVVTDSLPPYPLSESFSELREAVQANDAAAMARALVLKSAQLARRGISLISPHYQPLLLEGYIAAAQAALLEPSKPEQKIGSDTTGSPTFDELTFRVRSTPSGLQYEALFTPAPRE